LTTASGGEKARGDFTLYVSIADVSHYVTPGSPLDKEADQRGTSVYFPQRAVHMLPENLATNVCSLIPGEDRLAVTAILHFDRRGRRKTSRFTRAWCAITPALPTVWCTICWWTKTGKLRHAISAVRIKMLTQMTGSATSSGSAGPGAACS
jgi:exoribonuclease II